MDEMTTTFGTKEDVEARNTGLQAEGLGSVELKARMTMLNVSWAVSRTEAAYTKAVEALVAMGANWSTLDQVVKATAARTVAVRIADWTERAQERSEEPVTAIAERNFLLARVTDQMGRLDLGSSTSGVSNELARAESAAWMEYFRELTR